MAGLAAGDPCAGEMIPGSPAVRLPWVLLLLWLPGCSPLSGPSIVTGTIGGSLSVRCQYEKDYKISNKYWCRQPLLLPLPCSKIVETKDSGREASGGRVSIRDHPENLTFTVTLEDLTLEDAGSYWCGIDTPWHEIVDDHLTVVVSVFPESTLTPTSVSVAKTSTTETQAPAMPSTTPASKSLTQGSSSQKDQKEQQGPSLLVPLSLLMVLLVLLVGASLLAWRMLQKPVKAGECSELSQNLRQAAEQSEPHYANLQLHTWSLREEPVPPRQVEVEYSTVAFTGEEPHYTSVVFDSQRQDTNANGAPFRTPRVAETEYSVIQKPTNGHPSPHP